MVRSLPPPFPLPTGSPHARGDGPCACRVHERHALFSPRAWGWSDIDGQLDRIEDVLPTRVGMVRLIGPASTGSIGSPHARGDGPRILARVSAAGKFSPRAWGWSAYPLGRFGGHRVLPTRVGMVRRKARLLLPLPRSPHARGDGPPNQFDCLLMQTFSPRAWGWSVNLPDTQAARDVLPTRVGMVREKFTSRSLRQRSPHARGDGPKLPPKRVASCGFSPRAWGWSLFRSDCSAGKNVLPTRVGMVRCQLSRRREEASSPHARGDGPRFQN